MKIHLNWFQNHYAGRSELMRGSLSTTNNSNVDWHSGFSRRLESPQTKTLIYSTDSWNRSPPTLRELQQILSLFCLCQRCSTPSAAVLWPSEADSLVTSWSLLPRYRGCQWGWIGVKMGANHSCCAYSSPRNGPKKDKGRKEKERLDEAYDSRQVSGYWHCASFIWK